MVKLIFVSILMLLLFFVNRMKLVVTAEKERLEKGKSPIEKEKIDRKKEGKKKEVSKNKNRKDNARSCEKMPRRQ